MDSERNGRGSEETLERRTREIGAELFARIGRGPGIGERAWWDDRLMDLTMGEETVKVQLFRFIDALPSLTTSESVRRHLDEYLDEAGGKIPWALAVPLAIAPKGGFGTRVLATAARSAGIRMAKRFIAGSTPNEALQTVLKLRKKRLGFTADLLGEAIIAESEADAYQQTCLELLRGLSGPLAAEPEIAQIDRDDQGPIPRLNLSLKLTSLTARFDPIHAETTEARVLQRLRPIFRTARELDAFVNIDMEQYAYKDLTYHLFKTVLMEPEFRDWSNVGIVCQAYLPEALGDLDGLAAWVEKRGAPVSVRLVKGAYWDYEVSHARQVGWPVPVFVEKWATDANYERCARFLMERHERLRPALGSHNIRSLARGLALAERYKAPRNAFEVQMLHGMGDSIARAFVDRGLRVRVYTPYGAMLPGMAYLVRRLLENTSNESFLRAGFGERAPIDRLLKNPEEIGAVWTRNRLKPERRPPSIADREPPPFRNEPPTDFSRSENREKVKAALAEVRGRLGGEIPLVIDGENVSTTERIESRDPGDAETLVALVSAAGEEHADRAVRGARAAFDRWSRTPASERAGIILRAAAIMREKRFELIAWEVFECAKPWREADGDVAEAIDFCEFYAREMLRLSAPIRRDVPGETNAIEHIARGVVVVIPPWNFPLAIPTGMTVAALATGNTVVLKPAEQSPAIARRLFDILREAGVPDGALQFLPGVGEVVGRALVEHIGVDLVAFTGSRNVGLAINRQAAEVKPGQDRVKRAIAEMGGKNAIIVDDDADLDEAVVGVLTSAFGYAGQKCSACSRAIVLDSVHDAFLNRLVEAAKALPVGPADDPDTAINAVIDREARDRILKYAAIARSEGRVVLDRVDVGPELAAKGNYVGPLIVSEVSPSARIAQEEIFGPILAVFRARDLDEALAIANGTEYALTGGLYSRSPAHIARIRREFFVGNLYVNRQITGALVDRQPFGGFKLSGLGSKAGGEDYLREFMLTRSIAENTMRRGFAPDLGLEEREIEAGAAGI